MWPIPDSMTLSDDHRAVAWVQQGLLPRSRESGYRVGDIVPQGFEAYARIFHPVSRYSSDGREREIVRWSQIASWNGRVAHPAMQLHAILGQTNPSRVKIDWGQEPTDGRLDRAEAATLSEILAEFTTTPQTCFFCIWEGWGWLGGPESFAYLGTAGGVRPQQDDKERAARKRLEEAGRLDVGAFKYLLFTGRLGAPQEMGEIGDGPSLWWPQDRAWFVGTDIDMTSTFVGGTEKCISALVDHPGLEAFPIGIDVRIDTAGDTINV